MSYNLNTQLQTQTIYLSSARAKSRDPFNFQFNSLIQIPSSTKILISVEEFVITNFFDNIVAPKNKIIFDKAGQIITVEIPTGLYNVKQFVSECNAQLLGSGITCVYQSNYFKMTFVSTSLISLTYTDIPQILGVARNIDNEYIYPVNASTPVFTIWMPNSIDMSGSPYIFLKCNDILVSNLNSYGDVNNTLCRIPVNVNSGYKIFYRPTETTKYLVNNSAFTSLSFYLEDVFNNPIIPQNDFQMLLKISYIYPPDEKNIMTGTLLHHINTIMPDEETQIDDDGELN